MIYKGYEIDNTSSIARVFIRAGVATATREIAPGQIVADFATVSEATEHVDKLVERVPADPNNNENAPMISEALKSLRLYHEFSITELAAALDISQSYLSEIEANKKTISITLLAKYKQALDLPISVIIDFAEDIELLQQGPGMNELDYARHKLQALTHILEKKGKLS